MPGRLAPHPVRTWRSRTIHGCVSFRFRFASSFIRATDRLSRARGAGSSFSATCDSSTVSRPTRRPPSRPGRVRARVDSGPTAHHPPRGPRASHRTHQVQASKISSGIGDGEDERTSPYTPLYPLHRARARLVDACRMPSAVCRHHPAAHTRCHPPGADRRHHRPRSPPRRCARTRPSTTPPACAHVGTAPPYLSLARAHESLPIREQERSTHASTRVRGRSSSSLSLSRSLRSVLSPVLLTTGATIISAVAEAEGVSLDAGGMDENGPKLRGNAPNGAKRSDPAPIPSQAPRDRYASQIAYSTASITDQICPESGNAAADDPSDSAGQARRPHPCAHVHSYYQSTPYPRQHKIDLLEHRGSITPAPRLGVSGTIRHRTTSAQIAHTKHGIRDRSPRSPTRSIQKREKPPRGFEPRT
jgi:hypothetical protein